MAARFENRSIPGYHLHHIEPVRRSGPVEKDVPGMKLLLKAVLLAALAGPLAAQDAAQNAGPVFNGPSFSTRLNTTPDIPVMETQEQEENPNARAALATTTPDYPVTPGDIYTLAYQSSLDAVSIPLNVDNEANVSMAIFGRMKAENLTFAELKKRIEQKVLAGYPNSNPQVNIQYNGTFQVMVKGEVSSAGFVSAWGLTRLGQVIAKRLTPYGSIRDVTVVSAKGETRRYDLFAFSRHGDLAQNPYVRPGDTVIVARAPRSVVLEGSVRRPGRYQLLEGEGLARLVQYYGDGFTPLADESRIWIRRFIAQGTLPVESLYVEGSLEAVELRDLDVVNVALKTELMPAVYFEGALSVDDSGTSLDTSRRVVVRFEEGVRLSTVIKKLAGRLSPVSDLQRAYILRVGEAAPIPVNLEDILYNRDRKGNDCELRPFDQVIIPFRQLFVTVSGAVKTPGRFPYIPDRPWQYYVNLAGGVDRDKNANDKLQITDVHNQPRDRNGAIQPEDIIRVEYNSFLYQFTRAAPVISVFAAVVSLTLGILTLATR